MMRAPDRLATIMIATIAAVLVTAAGFALTAKGVRPGTADIPTIQARVNPSDPPVSEIPTPTAAPLPPNGEKPAPRPAAPAVTSPPPAASSPPPGGDDGRRETVHRPVRIEKGDDDDYGRGDDEDYSDDDEHRDDDDSGVDDLGGDDY